MKKTLVASLTLAAFAQVYAAPFTAGNLVVVQLGLDTRATALSNAAAEVFLKEYTPAGVLVQTIAMPADFTMSGSSTAEGFISFGGGRFALTGYNAAAATAAVASTTAARTVGLVALNGTSDTTTKLVDAYTPVTSGTTTTAGNIRSAVFDGTNIWTAGNANSAGNPGIRVTTLGATTTTQVATAPTNTRVLNIANNQVYFSTGSANFNGINFFDSAFPTTSGATATNAPGMADIFVTSTAGTLNSSVFPSTYDFAFADANTLYIAEDNGNGNAPTNGTPERGGVYKLTFDALQSKWVLAYILKAGLPTYTSPSTQSRGARGLALGKNGSGQTVIYVTSADTSNGIYAATDTGSSATFSLVVQAGAFNAFRGLEIVPGESGGSRTITGSINLGGDWAGSATNANNITVPFDINDGAATVNASLTFVNGTASYSITVPGGVGAGPVKLAAKFTTFLRKVRGSVALGSSGQDFTMVNGNVDGDTEVSILDYIELSTAYGSVEGSGAYGTGTADLDKDGEVSILDYIILSTTYGQADEA